MNTIISVPISNVTEESELPSLTYALDLDSGRIRGKVNELQAVNQAIRKALITPRFKCLIYDNQYGSEIKSTVTAKDATSEFIETELPRLVEDALSTDGRILEVHGFEFSFSNDTAYIKFSADTIFGTITVEEVV